MTLRETLLQELETADDGLIAATIDWLRSQKFESKKCLPSGEPIRRGAKLGDLLEFSGTWEGNDLEDCLKLAYTNRSQVTFTTDNQLFE